MVLDRDYPEDGISDLKPVLTMVSGKVVCRGDTGPLRTEPVGRKASPEGGICDQIPPSTISGLISIKAAAGLPENLESELQFPVLGARAPDSPYVTLGVSCIIQSLRLRVTKIGTVEEIKRLKPELNSKVF